MDPDRATSEAGYNLVVMVIVILVFNVMVATAWPLWSAFAQREKEEVLIFRGLQYAEAIRVFQKRFGRYPNRLEELVELEPRCLRQLWDDPMTEDGKWGLIYGSASGGGKGKRGVKTGGRGLMEDIIKERRDASGKTEDVDDQGSVPPRGRPGAGQPRPGSQRAAGPITGVFSKSDESGFKTFFGQSSYREWKFTSDLVSQPPMGPTGVRTPHIGPRTLGKPFRGDISAPGAGGPGPSPKGAPMPGRGNGPKGRPDPPELPAGKG